MENRTVCLWSANSAIQRSFSHSFWVPFFCSRPKSRSFPMQFQMWITTHHIWSSFLRPWIWRTQERNPKKPRPLSCIITRVLTVTDYYKSSFELLQAKKVQLMQERCDHLISHCFISKRTTSRPKLDEWEPDFPVYWASFDTTWPCIWW